MSHIPVLLNEVIKFLDPKAGDIVLDATIDGGGHAKAILEKITPNGKLIGIDQDKELLDALNDKFLISSSVPTGHLPQGDKNIILINGNFRNLDKLLEPFSPKANPPPAEKIESLNGALYDLGMSSSQLEESGRGFSFLKNEPLLMTYKFPLEPQDLTAEKILNTWSEKEIADIIFRYGEERYARRIAKNINERRKESPFKTTFDLVEVIKKSIPRQLHLRRHPATKTFQALRIAVNDELEALTDSLEKIWKFLIPGSRLVIISFHSLEDRIVKQFFSAKGGSASGGKEGIILTKKPIVPSDEEILLNPRSRSAKLRAAIKISAKGAGSSQASG